MIYLEGLEGNGKRWDPRKTTCFAKEIELFLARWCSGILC